MKISLFPRQHDFVMSEALHPACISGRGGGKTVAGVTKVFRYHGENHGARGCITEPTLGAIDRNLIPAIYDTFGSLKGKVWDLHKSTTSYELRFPAWDGVCYLRQSVGTNPMEAANSLRGMTLAYWWMDEVQEGFQYDAFRVLEACLRQVQDEKPYPYQGWVSGTPNWRKRWIADLWLRHLNPTTQDVMTAGEYPLFQMRTKDNRSLSPLILRQLEETYGNTRLAQQELEGEFITVEGPAFPQFREDVHVRVPPPDLQFKRKLVGIDFGTASPTAMIELGLGLDNRVWALREFYMRMSNDYDWIETFREWEGKALRCDPSRSLRDIEALQRIYGIPIKASKILDFSTRYRVMNARLAIQSDGRPNMYISPECPNLIGELQNLAFDVDSNGNVQDKWERGLSDHAFDGCCYALGEFEVGYKGRPQPTFELVRVA